MSRRPRRLLVDLAGSPAPCDRLHLESVLPALIAARPDDVVRVVGPGQRTVLARSWGAGTARARRASLLGEADLVLRPLNAFALPTRTPQVLWSWHGPEREGSVSRRERMWAEVSLRTSGRALVVYPTAATRLAAELSGRTGPGLVLSPPLTSSTPRPGSGHAARGTAGRTSSLPLRILVPTPGRRGDNLALLPRLSRVLTDRGVDHQVLVAGQISLERRTASMSGNFHDDPSSPEALLGRVDAALLPAVDRVCPADVVRLQDLGLSVAASDVPTHRELRRGACLFDPASPRGAADALISAGALTTSPSEPRQDADEPGTTTAAEYAAELSREIDRMIEREAPEWAV